MVLRASLTALLCAMLVQNLAEGLAGGPAMPAMPAVLMPAEYRPLTAIALITVALVGFILPALIAPTRAARFLAAMAAGGLALNAVLQVAASAVAGRWLPGSISGAVLMLPAALAVLWALGRTSVKPAILGMVLSPLVLLTCWHFAALLT